MNDPKTAIITGAARGIGAVISRHFAAAGYQVILNYNTRAEAAEAVCAGIRAAGGSATAFQADVTQEPQAAALMDFAIATHGRLDALVNNAGFAAGMPIGEIDAAHIDKILNINIRGTLLCCKHAARVFAPAGGAIINISSINGTNPMAGGVTYAGAKAAVNAITVGFARELGPRNIRVNAVAPGLTMTPRYLAEIPDDSKAAVIAETPLGRLGVPEDIAGLVLYLASNEARWVTGQIISASGGAT